jgi:hypothetical protein
VFILADDLGHGELGRYGNTFNETPHLELRELLAEWRERNGIEIPESCRDYNPKKFFWDPLVRWVVTHVIYRF